MKIFHKIISFLTVFFFTLNCTCIAHGNSQEMSHNTQALTKSDFLKKNSAAKENKNSKKQTQKFDFNKIKQNMNYIKSFGISFLKHIFSAVIDYCVASIMENLIETKIKNKNNITSTL